VGLGWQQTATARLEETIYSHNLAFEEAKEQVQVHSRTVKALSKQGQATAQRLLGIESRSADDIQDLLCNQKMLGKSFGMLSVE
jgi:hypothetical protein